MEKKRFEIEYTKKNKYTGEEFTIKEENIGYSPKSVSHDLFMYLTDQKENKDYVFTMHHVKEMDVTSDIDEMTPSPEEVAKGEIDG